MEATLRGSYRAIHAVHVSIDGHEFELGVDTGSSVMAVAATGALDCPRWYRGDCTGPPIHNSYADGTSWSGRICGPASIQLGGLSVNFEFAGIFTDHDFLHFSRFENCADTGTDSG